MCRAGRTGIVQQRAPQSPTGGDVGVNEAVAKKVIAVILQKLMTTSTQLCGNGIVTQGSNGTKASIDTFGEGQRQSPPRCEEYVPEVTPTEISDPRITNLAYFYPSTPFENLDSSCFKVSTRNQRISSGINGDVFKYEWSYGEESTTVAVKKLRNNTLQKKENNDRNEQHVHTKVRNRRLSVEDALTEIGIMQYLSKQPDVPLYLLKMHNVFAEAQHYTWLVTEFAEGGELFHVVAAHALTEAKVQEYMCQLLKAVEYLHRHKIGHRDISLENVLLKDGVVKLMDYGVAVSSHSPCGTPLRYYCEVGKAFYRAPECYVPTSDRVDVTAPCSAKPGDVVMTRVPPLFLCEVRLPQDALPGKSCLADVWGYAVVPADMFALGVCMFIMAFQVPPWECAKLSNRSFAYAFKSAEGVMSLVKLWRKQHLLSAPGTSMLSSMMQTDPANRALPADCLNHLWLAATPNISL